MQINWAPVCEIIRNHRRFVLTTHVRPDADALGSEIAMLGMLEALGKEVRIVNASPVPPRLAFIDPRQRIGQLGVSVSDEEALATDVHMILDTSAWGQLAEVGRVFKKTAAVKVVIDHHFSSEELGAFDFKDTEAEATGTLMYQLARALGVAISPEMAAAMYCAIATDTGWFRFPSTTSQTMRTIADLIDLGAQPPVLYSQLYEQYALSRLKLASRAMSRIRMEFDGRLAHTYVRQDDYAETGAQPPDTEDLVNECLTISGVEAAFICIEQNNGCIKTSFRSRLHIDVSRVAEQFRGGGHKQAAGAILPGPLADAQAKVLSAIKTQLGW